MFPLCSIGADGRKMAVQGERIPGGFILITGLDGIRYAVRPQSPVNAVSLPLFEQRGRNGV